VEAENRDVEPTAVCPNVQGPILDARVRDGPRCIRLEATTQKREEKEEKGK
jgi:hypothetical protein